MILVVVYNTVWVIFERLFQITETMKLFSRVTLGYLFLVFVWILDGEATAQEAVEVTIDARGRASLYRHGYTAGTIRFPTSLLLR